MSKLNLNIRYTNRKENTELTVGVNCEISEKQNDQSPKGMLGLVIDYFPLAVNVLVAIVPVITDTLSQMT
ncbi:hypothetical protein [Escherichia coli]|uniref:hypothetical protein n=1 Tax=Escherichia coli TaxID=562 RepID=UPI00122C7BE0|nr:hypothetical protein [Escherichia coli]MCE1631398.1 hypothetical protein [Enterobacter hormaechei]KAA1302552.1 hypothetical protein F1D84_23565 [Escherichia coli]KAA1308103.1 hypothetical protein F1D83_23350 [Escherichia coli]MCE1640322.1 hypothetical protein [Enterobacter hormaechei]MCE1644972.1 hypothetical protein [Enterobacter hormaechei]